MNKFRSFIFIFTALFALSIVGYFIFKSMEPKIAGLYVDSVPSSRVWINGRSVGKTPFRNTTNPGEAIVKLIPDQYGKDLIPYETKVNLVAGVETVIRYDLGESEDLSAGDIVSFEKDERKQTGLVAVSIPDSAIIIIDGQQRAFAPYKTTSISAGEHQLKFSLQGYRDRTIKVNIHDGYKLTAIIKLAKINEVKIVNEYPVVTNAPNPTNMVEILSTSLGYLRVRALASSLADEVGRVNPGERFPLIETDEKSGWYKIELYPAKQGWISNQYARKIISNTVSLTPSPNVSTPSAVINSPTLYLKSI